MIAKKSFLLLLTTIFLLVNSESKPCSFKSNPKRHDSTICCDGERYSFWHDTHYFMGCNKEPMNPDLSVEDSEWTVYTCMVEKALGNVSLTRPSYFALMAGNLSMGKREEIQNYAEPNTINGFDHETSTSMSLLGTPEKVHVRERLKKYWSEYFMAEFEVCHFMDSFSELVKTDITLKGKSKDSIRLDLEPSHRCGKSQVPDMIIMTHQIVQRRIFHYEYLKYYKCDKKLQKLYGRNIINKFMSQICWRVARNDVTVEELENGSLNYDRLVTSIFPYYWPLTVKVESRRQVLKRIAQRLPETSGNVSTLALFNDDLQIRLDTLFYKELEDAGTKLNQTEIVRRAYSFLLVEEETITVMQMACASQG